MALTFKGGMHIDDNKNTRRARIENLPPPAYVSLPMSQHIGAHCVPCVKAGDTVYRGQVIGRVTSGLGCPVHASVSGRVKEIREVNAANGAKIVNVIIENDGCDTPDPSIRPHPKKLSETTPEEIVSIIREAGISGMGGATFPTYAKLQSAIGRVKHLIVNCAECEPYITANHRLLLEKPATVINGVKILLKALGLRTAEIAVEDNKLDAINKLEELLAGSDIIRVRVMKTKYPQGDERQLIYALKGIELPTGKLPADVGCVIFNAETCSAVYNAFAHGMPLIERTVTCDGDCIKNPKNVLVPLGTPYLDVINFCGGLRAQPKKVISGGPMMGMAQWDIRTPVTKGTSAILVFSEANELHYEQPPTCIRCGRCVKNCPMHLMPNYLAAFSQKGSYEQAEEYGVMSCVECGTCSYNCPGQVPIVQYIRTTKAFLNSKKRAQQAALAASKSEEKTVKDPEKAKTAKETAVAPKEMSEKEPTGPSAETKEAVEKNDMPAAQKTEAVEVTEAAEAVDESTKTDAADTADTAEATKTTETNQTEGGTKA